MSVTYLTEDGGSWVAQSMLSPQLLKYADENFSTLFALHPADIGKVVMPTAAKSIEVTTSRYHRSYLRSPVLDNRYNSKPGSYMFCGLTESPNHELPVEFQPFLDHMNEIQNEKAAPLYNQVTINWYESGSNYIPYHSDNEIGMIENSTIAVLSLGGEIDGKPTRMFRLKKKNDKQPTMEYECKNGLILTMGGDTQKGFRHGVSKVVESSPRISISFRQFLE